MHSTFSLARSLRCGLAAGAASAVLTACVWAPYPYYPYYGYQPTTTTVKSAPSFDLSWDAALGAAADAGIQVTNADKGNGRITGTKAGSGVTIDVKPQADNTLRVTFTAPDSKETNPTLNERWLVAYQRRMGR
ncbi:MAG: hypothetical protein ACAH21_09280 [Ramlibacter sp.]|nr:hypothetical protein [Ramlibacter sp.]